MQLGSSSRAPETQASSFFNLFRSSILSGLGWGGDFNNPNQVSRAVELEPMHNVKLLARIGANQKNHNSKVKDTPLQTLQKLLSVESGMEISEDQSILWQKVEGRTFISYLIAHHNVEFLNYLQSDEAAVRVDVNSAIFQQHAREILFVVAEFVTDNQSPLYEATSQMIEAAVNHDLENIYKCSNNDNALSVAVRYKNVLLVRFLLDAFYRAIISNSHQDDQDIFRKMFRVNVQSVYDLAVNTSAGDEIIKLLFSMGAALLSSQERPHCPWQGVTDPFTVASFICNLKYENISVFTPLSTLQIFVSEKIYWQKLLHNLINKYDDKEDEKCKKLIALYRASFEKNEIQNIQDTNKQRVKEIKDFVQSLRKHFSKLDSQHHGQSTWHRWAHFVSSSYASLSCLNPEPTVNDTTFTYPGSWVYFFILFDFALMTGAVYGMGVLKDMVKKIYAQLLLEYPWYMYECDDSGNNCHTLFESCTDSPGSVFNQIGYSVSEFEDLYSECHSLRALEIFLIAWVAAKGFAFIVAAFAKDKKMMTTNLFVSASALGLGLGGTGFLLYKIVFYVLQFLKHLVTGFAMPFFYERDGLKFDHKPEVVDILKNMGIALGEVFEAQKVQIREICTVLDKEISQVSQSDIEGVVRGLAGFMATYENNIQNRVEPFNLNAVINPFKSRKSSVNKIVFSSRIEIDLENGFSNSDAAETHSLIATESRYKCTII